MIPFGDTFGTLSLAIAGGVILGLVLKKRARRAQQRRALARELARRRAQHPVWRARRPVWGGPNDGEPLTPGEQDALDGIARTEKSS